MTEDDLRGFTIGYERPNIENPAVSSAELEQRGYSRATFEDWKIASSGDLRLYTPRVNIGFEQMVANALDGLESNIPHEVTLTLENAILRVDTAEFKKDVLREKHIRDLTHKMADHSKVIQTLTNQLDQAHSEILQLRLSNSWRITRPLRKVAEFVRGKRNT